MNVSCAAETPVARSSWNILGSDETLPFRCVTELKRGIGSNITSLRWRNLGILAERIMEYQYSGPVSEANLSGLALYKSPMPVASMP